MINGDVAIFPNNLSEPSKEKRKSRTMTVLVDFLDDAFVALKEATDVVNVLAVAVENILL